jgi:hypothetical protein
MHDSTFYRITVHGIRVHVESHEPDRTLRPIHTLFRRRNCWWFCGGSHYPTGRHQDIVANARKCCRCGAQKRVWIAAGGENHSSKRRIQGIFPRTEAQNYHHNAQHGYLLVSAAQCTTFWSSPETNANRSAYEMAKAFFIRRSTDPSKSI